MSPRGGKAKVISDCLALSVVQVVAGGTCAAPGLQRQEFVSERRKREGGRQEYKKG